MIELILARHAKSDWRTAGRDDHDRPLNARGERDAPAMGRRLAEAGTSPGIILSSTATRARRTAEAYSAALGVPIALDDRLYLAPADTLWATAAGSGAESVMLVAHDPGLSDLAARLSDGGISHMPTCAVARFAWQFDSWREAAAQAPLAWSFASPGS